MNMEVKSTAFQDGAMIPKLYTCDDKDVSPPLSWSGVPAETKSIALIMDDPDAPRRYMGSLGPFQHPSGHKKPGRKHTSYRLSTQWSKTR